MPASRYQPINRRVMGYGFAIKMATTAELNLARKKLMDAVGDNNMKTYFAHMKSWFRQKSSKEEFDIEARKLLPSDAVRYHNEFLLAIFNKCQSLTSTHGSKDSSSAGHSLMKEKLRKGKGKKKARTMRATFERRFQSANPLLYAPQVVPKDAAEEERVVLCTREATLPALAMVHGRMFITAWDCGLDNVEDDAVRLMLYAVEFQMKLILTAVLSRRHGYSLREGKFMHGVGTPAPDPYRLNTLRIMNESTRENFMGICGNGEQVPSIKPTFEQAEANAVAHLACSKQNDRVLAPVSLQDVFDALQVNRSAIQSHSVCAVNMERLISRFAHPSHEELEQDAIRRQEIDCRLQLQMY